MSDFSRYTAETALHILRERGLTLATAESLTGGLVCASLTQIPGASDVVTAGLVVYSADAKSQILGIDAQDLRDHTVYSEWTARMMAQSAINVTGADVAVACTGVAGPGADEGVKAGNVWIAVHTPIHTVAAACVFEGDRDEIRFATVQRALELLIDTLRRD